MSSLEVIFFIFDDNDNNDNNDSTTSALWINLMFSLESAPRLVDIIAAVPAQYKKVCYLLTILNQLTSCNILPRAFLSDFR